MSVPNSGSLSFPAVRQRDEWEKKRKTKVKRERGWTGNSWGGISLGPPDPGPNGGKRTHTHTPNKQCVMQRCFSCFTRPIQPPVTSVKENCVCAPVCCEKESMRPALWPIWTTNEIRMCQNIKWDSFLILERHFSASVSPFCHPLPQTSVSVSLPLRSPFCLFPSFPLLLLNSVLCV